MADVGHFECPKRPFDRISGHRRPFWMGRQCQLSNLSEIFTSPPEGVARYCFHPVCLSVCVCVCVSVCVSVCPANILVFYFSAI